MNMKPRSGEWSRVVSVCKADAKAMKTKLEKDGMLNRALRMAPAITILENDENENLISLPIVPNSEYESAISADARVKKVGFQFCPHSSSFLGNNRRRLVREDGDSTTIQSCVMTAASKFLNRNETDFQESAILQCIRTLSVTCCPTTLELLGDDRTVVIPLNAFSSEDAPFRTFLDRLGHNRHDDFLDILWETLADYYNSVRVVRQNEIHPDSPVRRSGSRVLWTKPSHFCSKSGPGSPTWITVTEQRVRQSFDLTQVMFSRGNVSEKIRFGQLPMETEKVLDLYAGIGYFTLPALLHGNASHVHCCEWNPSAADALRFNLEDNSVAHRATVLEGDCRDSCKIHKLVRMFDRVSLGLLPSSEGGWECAVQSLGSLGGWLHVHGNVPASEVKQWALWLSSCLRNFAVMDDRPIEWVVMVTHVQKVKSFAPKVNHYVADCFMGNIGRLSLRNTADSSLLGNIEPCSTGVAVYGEESKFCNSASPPTPPSCALGENNVLHQQWMR